MKYECQGTTLTAVFIKTQLAVTVNKIQVETPIVNPKL